MKLLAAILCLSMASAVFGQAPPPPDAAGQDQPPAATQTQPSAGAPKNPDDTQPPPPEAQRSAPEIQPGSPVIQQKDMWDQSGIFHPFLRMPKYIFQDQKAIWTSPFHTAKKNLKYWAVFGAATGALIATDQWSVKQLPNSSSQVSVSKWGSQLGSAYSLIPISAGLYFIGTGTHHDRFRETGLLCFEALIDSNIAVEALKLTAGRARPLESDGKGHFEDSPSRWNSGFPSGHAINTWAMASVIAHQYPHPRIIPILAYGLASTVVIARVGARQHFPGDVLAGSAMGWFIGDYIFGKRHNRSLDH